MQQLQTQNLRRNHQRKGSRGAEFHLIYRLTMLDYRCNTIPMTLQTPFGTRAVAGFASLIIGGAALIMPLSAFAYSPYGYDGYSQVCYSRFDPNCITKATAYLNSFPSYQYQPAYQSYSNNNYGYSNSNSYNYNSYPQYGYGYQQPQYQQYSQYQNTPSYSYNSYQYQYQYHYGY
jgi:hypothetical protein